MQTKRQVIRQATRPVVVIGISLLLLVAVFTYLDTFTVKQQHVAHSLRLSMVGLQNAQQDRNRVDADRTHPLLVVLGEDITVLQVRMAEALAALRIDGESVAVSFEQSVLDTSLDLKSDRMIRSDESYGKSSSVSVLRVNLRARLFHTPQLLQFLQTVTLATAGWPSDIRACGIDRMADPSMVGQSLNIHCVMDVYHWLPSGT